MPSYWILCNEVSPGSCSLLLFTRDGDIILPVTSWQSDVCTVHRCILSLPPSSRGYSFQMFSCCGETVHQEVIFPHPSCPCHLDILTRVGRYWEVCNQSRIIYHSIICLRQIHHMCKFKCFDMTKTSTCINLLS